MMMSRPNEPRSPLRLGSVSAKPGKTRGRPRGRLGARLRRFLGLPKTVTVAGVRYRERSGLPVHRALGPGGPGVKEYDARFGKNGRTMRLRMTNGRQYADLGPSVRGSSYAQLAALIRPGDRILEISCGTGDGSARLAEFAGPSGALIAMTDDRESVRYARERYPSDTVGFELGGIEPVKGEVDGAFDRVVWALPGDLDGLDELARVLRPAGLLVVLVRRREVGMFDEPRWQRVTEGLFEATTQQSLGGTVAMILVRSARPHADSGPNRG